MDVYFEQSVENENIDKHKKRTSVLTIVRYILLALVVIIALVAFCTLQIVSVITTIINIVIDLLIIAPFIITYIFIGKLLVRSNLEYDYLLNGDVFRIVKVINRKKRKKLIEISVASFESIGRVTSENYDRYAASREIKKIFAICNLEEEDKLFYIYFIKDGVKSLLHIQPNDEMILSLRRSIPRITVMDKSAKI